MTSVLILCAAATPTPGLDAALERVGVRVIGATQCDALVQAAVRLEPDVVVAQETVPPPALFAATALLASAHPVAVAVFTDDVRVESMEKALASGIHAWIVRGFSPDRLRAELQLARLRFARERLQLDALASLGNRLDERTLVDRAKGILMDGGKMAEHEAFRTLRTAAMQGKERLGQVAQRLIDAARNAEAINRAGQLRMLSQRLVKLHLLAALGVEPASAGVLRTVSIDRLMGNLDALGELLSAATFGDLLEACRSAWERLRAALFADPQDRDVQAIDTAAEALLQSAERLTAALESASPVARLHVMNLPGRQRMLSQRYAKLALLHGMAAGPPEQAPLAALLASTGHDFEKALQMLEQSPLTDDAGRQRLASVAQVWADLRNSPMPGGLPQSRLAIAQTSEALLEHFERLTESYEHSVQVLVG